MARQPVEVSKRQIMATVCARTTPCAFRSSGTRTSPASDRVAWCLDLDGPPVDGDRAGTDGIGSGDCANQFRAPRTDDAGNPENFASMDRSSRPGKNHLVRSAHPHAKPPFPKAFRSGKDSIDTPSDHILERDVSTGTWAVSCVATSRPSRNTATLSAIRAISSSRWLM